jgi:hypothetical protein
LWQKFFKQQKKKKQVSLVWLTCGVLAPQISIKKNKKLVLTSITIANELQVPLAKK